MALARLRDEVKRFAGDGVGYAWGRGIVSGFPNFRDVKQAASDDEGHGT